MNKTYQLKTHASRDETTILNLQSVTRKVPITVRALRQARYELIDPSTDAAPDNIRVKRSGQTLLVFFDQDAEPMLIIEDFYQVHTDAQATLVGRTEQGALHEYVPENGALDAALTRMGDGGPSQGMALGGQALASSEMQASGLLPVAGLGSSLMGVAALGAGVLGAGVLAAAGGGSADRAPVATSMLADSSDTGVKGDNITRHKTPSLTGTAPVDSQVTLTLNGKEYPIALNADGSYSFTLPETDPLPDGTHTPVLKVTHKGTTTAYNGTTLTVDTQTTVSISDSGFAATRQTLGGWAEAGDTVLVTDAQGHTLGSATTDSAGQWTLVPGIAAAPGPITALATDAAGNTATATRSNLINAGRSLVLGIALDSNNDGYINAAEKGSATSTDVTVSFDGTKVPVGSWLTVSDASHTQTLALTALQIAAGQASIAWALPAEGASLNVTATLTDANHTPGNTTPEASDSAQLDTTASLAGLGLTLRIQTDTDNNGFVSLAESAKNSAPGTFSSRMAFDKGQLHAGEVILVDASNGSTALPSITHVLTEQDISALGFDIAFPQPAEGMAQTVTARYRDMAGNVSPERVSDSAQLDAVIPSALGLSIAGDTNNDGYINASEKGTSATTRLIAIFDSSQASAGDSVTFSDGSHTATVTLTKEDVAAGKVSSPNWSLPAEGSKLQVKASIQDPAGNTSPVATDSAQLDTRPAPVGDPQITFKGIQLSSLQFTHPDEDGSYKLHIGTNVFGGDILHGALFNGPLLSAPSQTVLGKDIYLEFWDLAGNLSTSSLPPLFASTSMTVTNTTVFMI